ncbi:MAG: pseudouridine synthase [Butyrivibrio sp.]|jgi:23S rRNA pseudouridine2604 synthase|nr:pseudouridine synthase [Butyrivibrio sp.]
MEHNDSSKRLNQYMASCGICSRREADRYIESGRVQVNGLPAQTGMRIGLQDHVAVDGKEITPEKEKVVLAYYKPAGVVCTEKDAHAEKTIIEALDYPIRVTYAGRLDQDSDGLMIMTNDGELINEMMRSANLHEKEYEVQVDHPITQAFLEQMAKGVWLEELQRTTRPCQLTKTGKDTFRIILTQGLNRQIRRMCQAGGYDVCRLTRIRIMNVSLGQLQSGQYRQITGQELQTLYADCNGNRGGTGIHGKR